VTIAQAKVEWRNETAYSTDFDDFYCSMNDAVDERNYVFIKQNNLISRWRTLNSGDSFYVGELGFGAGINFLLCCQHWLETSPENCTLYYYAAESHPLSVKDLSKIIKLLPALGQFGNSLIGKYPQIVKGFHKISLFDNRVQLCLMFGDAGEMFEALAESSDPAYALHNKNSIQSWFLDGFSPAKNPSIWRQSLFQILAALSSEETTLSTYSAARYVADNLKNAGFSIEHRDGFAEKRQLIFARTNGQKLADLRRHVKTHYWHLDSKTKRISNDDDQVMIIGAGIAGCTTAAELAKRGYKVTLVDRYSKPAQGASGNKQAVVYPKLSIQQDPLPLINLKAMLYAAEFYQPFWHLGMGKQCGVILLTESGADSQAFKRLANQFSGLPSFVQLLTHHEIEKLTNIDTQAQQALYFPTLGWLSPVDVCQALLNHANITFVQADVQHIRQDQDSNTWSLIDSRNQLIRQSKRLVVASSHDCERFEQTNIFGLKKLRGQVTDYPRSDASEKLSTVICGDGYITPAHNGFHSIGATYNLGINDLTLKTKDHQKNIDQIKRTDSAIGQVLKPTDVDKLTGRANFRCTTRDYLPIAGPVPKAKEMIDSFDFLRNDARKQSYQLGSYYSNLYVNCGMGSRGLGYAPITAELIADEITHSLSSTQRDLRLAMHPARFLIRDLKKKRI
jgi:tRNA 5-methylaminomethyl-2-thiouridine biosynthesis bifunctional protein